VNLILVDVEIFANRSSINCPISPVLFNAEIYYFKQTVVYFLSTGSTLSIYMQLLHIVTARYQSINNPCCTMYLCENTGIHWLSKNHLYDKVQTVPVFSF